jgi:hypothetical protein
VLDVPTVSGATYFFRRRMWDAVDVTVRCTARSLLDAEGAFLPTRHFYEETYCSYHARLHDWRVVYLGTAKMIHLWHRSSTVGSQDILGPRAYFLRALDRPTAWRRVMARLVLANQTRGQQSGTR